MRPGLTDLHIKCELPGALFAISRNHLTPQELAEGNHSRSVRPQVSKHQKHMEVPNLNFDQDRFGSSSWTPESPAGWLPRFALFLSLVLQ